MLNFRMQPGHQRQGVRPIISIEEYSQSVGMPQLRQKIFTLRRRGDAVGNGLSSLVDVTFG